MLYMAYGSNINREQMQRRCPGAVFVKKMVLRDHRLVFRHVASVERCTGTDCPVVLYEINAAHEHDLDHAEGVRKNEHGECTGMGIYRKEYAILEDGSRALIYIMNDDGIAPPSKEYYARIKAGYEYFKMELKPLRNALLHSWVAKKHSDTTQRRSRGRELQQHKGYKPPKAKGKKGKRKHSATLPLPLDEPVQPQRSAKVSNFNDWLAERKASGRSY